MNIEKLISEIIPPSDYQHRNGFNNIPIIDKLTENEKKQIEKALIERLQQKTDKESDPLIVETLAYMKSWESLPVLKNLLEQCSVEVIKLVIASSIYEINQDNDMIDIAITTFRKLDNNKDSYFVYKLISAFNYLIKFNKPEVNRIIEEYINHKEYLVSYNAKQALRIQ